jgi:hypothetical protein
VDWSQGCAVDLSVASRECVSRSAWVASGADGRSQLTIAHHADAGTDRLGAVHRSRPPPELGSSGAFGSGHGLGRRDLCRRPAAFFSVAALAAYLPARRDTRLDPLIEQPVLRSVSTE